MEDASHSPLTNATVSLSNMPRTTSGTAVQIVRGLGWEVKASDVFLFGLHPKHLRATSMKPESLQNSVTKRGAAAESFLLSGFEPVSVPFLVPWFFRRCS